MPYTVGKACPYFKIVGFIGKLEMIQPGFLYDGMGADLKIY